MNCSSFMSLQLLAAKVLLFSDMCKKKAKKYHFYDKTEGKNLEISKNFTIFARNFEKKI